MLYIQYSDISMNVFTSIVMKENVSMFFNCFCATYISKGLELEWKKNVDCLNSAFSLFKEKDLWHLFDSNAWSSDGTHHVDILLSVAVLDSVAWVSIGHFNFYGPSMAFERHGLPILLKKLLHHKNSVIHFSPLENRYEKDNLRSTYFNTEQHTADPSGCQQLNKTEVNVAA